jgi:YaiO family outer membrane protein
MIALLFAGGAAAQETTWKHELRFGSDTDRFNYTDAATAESFTITSKWNSRWTTAFTSTSYQRFGADAQRFTGRVSRKIGSSSWISAAGGAAHDEQVIPKREAAFELGHAMRVPGKHFVRGVELAYGQQWMWYSGSKVLVLSGSSFLYLPRDWTFTLTAAGARSTFRLPQVDWRPSGGAKLAFPLRSRWRGNVAFAVGTENFATADALGHFSARTFGGGLRYQVSSRQDIGLNVAYQERSRSRNQISVGVSYGIRF